MSGVITGSVLARHRLAAFWGLAGDLMAGCTRSAKAADADDFIRTLPDGYDAPAGQRGCRLWHGGSHD